MATKVNSAGSADVPTLPVAEGEEPWTAEEVAEIHAELVADLERMRKVLSETEDELADRMAEGPDGAGKDPADVGSSNFERDQEMSLHANTKAMLLQTELAMRLLTEGGYGYCESCGLPIGKLRLQVYPRATLCLSCKQREERR